MPLLQFQVSTMAVWDSDRVSKQSQDLLIKSPRNPFPTDVQSQDRLINHPCKSLPADFLSGRGNPISTDVLCGRGKKFINHPGNQNLRALVKQLLPHYDQLDNTGKRSLQLNVYAKATLDGKFMTLKDDRWIELQKKDALQKILQHFRTAHSELQMDFPSPTANYIKIDPRVTLSFTTVAEF